MLNDLIKQAQEEFEELDFAECPTEEAKPFFWRWRKDALKLIKERIATSIRESIAQAFKETRVRLKDLKAKPICYCKINPEHNCGITSNEAVQDTLSEIKKKQEEFMGL